MPPARTEWSKGERRWVVRMGTLAAAVLFLTAIVATSLGSVDVFLALVVLGAGLTVASLLLAFTLVSVELALPAPLPQPAPRVPSPPALLVRHDVARHALRSAEQRAALLVRATDRRSRSELDVLRRLVARVYAQQALLHASMGDARKLEAAVGELREELVATARTVMIAGPSPRRAPLQR